MWDRLIPISLVAELAYCERNFYYRACERVEDENAYTVEGSLQEERRNERERLARGYGLQVRRVMLSSEKLGVVGILDAVEEADDGVLYPVEYKRGSAGESRHHAVQLCLQAMVLEESTGRPVTHGYIYYSASRTRRKVVFDAALRRYALRLVERAREILHHGEVPPPVADDRCRDCALLAACMPYETAVMKEEAPPPPIRRIVAGAPEGVVLYVDEHGAYIGKRGGRLVVTKGGERLYEAPALSVRQVVIAANVNISTQALRFLLRMNVEIVYISSKGRFEGRFVPEQNKNSLLRMSQYGVASDERRSLGLSRLFVAGKIANMRSLLMRHNRLSGDLETSRACARLKALVRGAAAAATRDELLGIEGAAAKTYFAAYGRLFRRGSPPFDFTKRTKRPPRDEVNAMLGFGYTLLVGEAVAALSIAGLDPYIGFYHSSRYGRPALALDLMEEFRTVIVDSLVVALVNKSMIDRGHFVAKYGGVYLDEKGRETFFRAYEEKINTEVIHPVFGYRAPYRRVIEIQARLLAKVVAGDVPRYIPYKMR